MFLIDALRGATSAYADYLCDETHTLDSVRESLENGSDEAELLKWNITKEQWVTAHKAAIEWLESFSEDSFYD